MNYLSRSTLHYKNTVLTENEMVFFSSTSSSLPRDIFSILYFLFQGNIGSTNWGINLLMEEDIIPEIVRMAEECEHFAIRG